MVEVFKFGGASVRNSKAVLNVAEILKKFAQNPTAIVVSAMGKTTNNLENVVRLYTKGDDHYSGVLQQIIDFHLQVAEELLPDDHDELQETIVTYSDTIIQFCTENKSVNTPFIYDQIVSLGELLSTQIISHYLNKVDIDNRWIDAREIIRTDNRYMSSRVDFEKTEELVKVNLKDLKSRHIITQGFIGSTSERFTTTLAREGSDYTAAILAYCLDASKVIVWKDVPGIQNADPKMFDDTIKLNELSYLEAIEMTFYGAKVIHPKTIKPLQNKNIPMEVRSFLHPSAKGTLIMKEGFMVNIPPIIVVKTGQVLITLIEKDFDFVSQSGLGEILNIFSKHDIKINMMQNGAVSFSAVVDYNERKLEALIEDLHSDYKIKRNENLELLTIRHYDAPKLEELTEEKEILLMQQTRNTVQVLMK